MAIPAPFAALFTVHVLMHGRVDILWTFGPYYFGLVLAGSGALAVAAWDDLFPDEVDQEVLVPLPVRGGTLMGAKVLAVVSLMGIGALALNALTPMVFASFIELPGKGGPGGLQLFGAYLASGLLASLFAFTLCGVLRGTTLFLPHWRAVRRASSVIQSLVAFSLVSGLAMLPSVAKNLPQMGKGGPGILLAAPPAWFVGLAQMLAGYPRAHFQELASAAIRATAISTSLLVVIFPLGFRRFFLLRKDGGSEASGVGSIRLELRALNRFILRNPLARGTFWFFLNTLWRGSGQRIRLLSFLAVGAGWIFIVHAASGRGAELAAPMVAYLAVAGTRSACGTVVQERASWLIRITETKEKWGYTSGLRWGFWLGVLAPVFLALASWVTLTAAVSNPLVHIVLNLLAASLLAEAVLIGSPRFPFATLPSPGHISEPVALVLGFFAYIALARAAEKALVGNPFGQILAFGALATLLVGTAAHHRWMPPRPFVFQETENLLSSHIFEGEE
jgi:hypothetical protein